MSIKRDLNVYTIYQGVTVTQVVRAIYLRGYYSTSIHESHHRVHLT